MTLIGGGRVVDAHRRRTVERTGPRQASVGRDASRFTPAPGVANDSSVRTRDPGAGRAFARRGRVGVPRQIGG